MNAYLNMWKNYVNFTDRTSRADYWVACLVSAVVVFIIYIIGASTGMEWLSNLYSTASFLPALAIGIRRLRDAGKSWTWMFITFLPIIGWI